MAKAGTGADTTEHYLQTRFDYVYTMMLGYGLVFLLPCLIGIIAAILFFIERDCDTSKNLRTIPVTNTQLIMAKKFLCSFIFSVAFCLISTLSVALFCKLFHVGMVYGMTYKIFMSLIFGVLIVAASLPIVFLIIYFNKSFLLSILLAFFIHFTWAILGTIGTSISAAKIAFLNSFPVICVMNWTSGLMMDNLQKIIFCRKPMRLYQLLSIQFFYYGNYSCTFFVADNSLL